MTMAAHRLFRGRRRRTQVVLTASPMQSLYHGSPRQDDSEHIISPKISRSAQPENRSTLLCPGGGESGLITINDLWHL